MMMFLKEVPNRRDIFDKIGGDLTIISISISSGGFVVSQ